AIRLQHGGISGRALRHRCYDSAASSKFGVERAVGIVAGNRDGSAVGLVAIGCAAITDSDYLPIGLAQNRIQKIHLAARRSGLSRCSEGLVKTSVRVDSGHREL